jgi:hypothetical protein
MLKMNTNLSAMLIFALAIFSTTQAQEKKEDKLSISLSMNHDAFFGFNPAVTASYPVSPKTDLTFYGIQWGAGTARAWGNYGQ